MRVFITFFFLLLAIKGFGQTAVSQYSFPNTSSSPGWVKLGKYNAVQGGSTIRIEITSHVGYNATNAQDFISTIYFKTSNGGSVNANGFAGNSWFYNIGYDTSGLSLVKWLADSSGTAAKAFDLYVYMGAYTQSSTYAVFNSSGTWNHYGNVNQADPGAESDLVLWADRLYNLGRNTELGSLVLKPLNANWTSSLNFRNPQNNNQFNITSDYDGRLLFGHNSQGFMMLNSLGGMSLGNYEAPKRGSLRLTGDQFFGTNSNNTNNWTFHTPDDGRQTMYICPWNYSPTSPTWDWGKGIYLEANGEVTVPGTLGVGTTNPGKTLEIKGGNEVGLRIFNSNANFWDISNSEYGKLDFVRGNVPVMRLDQFGNVGIGTQLSQYRLEVSADAVDKAAIQVSYNGAQGDMSMVKYFNGYTQRWLTGMYGYDALGRDFVIKEEHSGETFRFNQNGNFQIEGGGLYSAGKVKIGTEEEPEDYMLVVGGKALVEKVVVRKQDNWPDFVFHKNYELPELSEVEAFIKSNNHLPEIPSAKEIERNGQDLAEMNRLLLKKVEELTLHLINQNKKLTKQDDKINFLLSEMEKNRGITE